LRRRSENGSGRRRGVTPTICLALCLAWTRTNGSNKTLHPQPF
jgi:hypothetical protein